MILEIRYYGDPVLRKKALSVTEVDEAIRELGENLIETMRAENGIGLAAPQVGVSLRLIAVDAGPDRGKPLVLLNPEVADAEGTTVMEEGCLSFPEIFGKIERAGSITVTGRDLEGKPVRLRLESMEARVFQHELDHLDGVLFIDRMSPSHKIVISGKLKKLRKRTREKLSRS